MPRGNKKRCECSKVVYATREEAHFIIGLMIERDSRADLLSVYRCERLKEKKRGWHVGHNYKKYEAFKENKYAAENHSGD